MAYIPDEAVDRMTELSAGAWRLYCFLARCRNGKTGKCFPSVRTAAEAIDVHPKNIFRLRNELSAAGWAKFNGDHVNALFGFESSKNATADVETIKDTATGSKNATIDSENTTFGADGSKNTTDELQKHYPVVAKTLPDGSKNATPYKEEPAKEPTKLTSKEEQDMSNSRSTDVQEVFTYWQNRLNHSQSKLTPKRKKLTEARLKEKYTVEQLKSAIDGCRASPWHMGQNPNGTVWDDLALICRDGEHVEMFIAKGTNNNGTQITKTNVARTTEDYGIRDARQI